jgi:DNA helicase II / ATP-dependent DNA helicase PcrA
MRERLTILLGCKAAQIAIQTFHSLGLSILREYPTAAGLSQDFRIASEQERVAVLRDAMDVSESKAETLLRTISKSKLMQGPMSVETAQVLEIYAQALSARSWIDFDDCVGLALRALNDPNVARHYRERFHFVSIDEFQDIDEQQYRLIAQLAPPPAHLCVIGDPDQAIYGFRGADASCFARLCRDYAPQEIRLQRNYRSSGTIVAASAQVMAAKDAASSIVRAMQERITIHVAPTDHAEAEFVVQTIEGLIGGHSFFSIDSGRAGRASTNLSFSDFAVLYRTDAQSAPLIEAMARSGIPFRKNGQDVLDPEDRVAADTAPVTAHGEHVSLLTLHAAKGLEFRVVFVVGLEDGLLPLRFGAEAPSPEERRLFYVGMTRAEDHLILTRALGRRWRGKIQSLLPSPFLQDIESELLKVQRNEALRHKPQDRQLSLF